MAPYSKLAEVAEAIIMDDLPEEPTGNQGLEPSIKHQEPDTGLSGDNDISTSLPSSPDIGMFEVARMKSSRDSMSAMTGMGSLGVASDLAKRMSAMTGMDSLGVASDLAKRMNAITGMGSLGAASDLAKRMSAITGMGSLGAASEAARRMQDSLAITGMGSLGAASELAKRMQDSMSAITGMRSLVADQMKSLSDAMRAVTGTRLLNGMTDWQKSIQESMKTIVGIGSMSGLSGLQKMMDALPYHEVLDLNAKPWLAYARSVNDLSSYMPTHLDSLTAALNDYDSRISQQVGAFDQVQYLKSYQKRSLIAHESRQKAVRLGPRDLKYADTIAEGINATQSLVDQIAGVSKDEEYPDSSSIEAEVFNALANEGPEYPVPLRGAIQAASSDNPDKARQTIVSLRELTMHILHQLSPEADVKKWSSRPEHYYNGQPTRACRIEYIFRGCIGSSIRPYIENEVKFMKDFIDFLNGGTHSLNTRLDECELRYAIYKTESLILLLLKYARR
jgi:hypothetical protein